MKTLISAFLFFCAVTVPANADQKVFAMNGWEGRRYDKDGAYSHCAAETYRVMLGTVLVLSVRPDGSLAIAAQSPLWYFRPDAIVAAEVMIDGTLIANQAEAIDINALRVVYRNPGEVRDAYETVANGKVITIRTSSGKFSFALKTPGKVLDALIKCNEQAVAEEFRAPEPGGLGAVRQSRTQRVDQAEAMVYVVNLLSAAGMTGQVYLQPSEYRDVLPDYDVVWENPDGTLGAAALYTGARRSDLDLATSNILSGEAAFCQGNFASGVKKKEESETFFLKEMFTTCDMDESVRETYYVVYVSEKGLLMAVGTIALTSGQQELVEDTGAAIARGAERSF